MLTWPKSVSSFYHVYADGDWEEAAREYKQALEQSGFSGRRYGGIVGSLANRQRAYSAVSPWAIVAEEEHGHEQVTLRALHAWAKATDPDAAVLYAHTKGAAYSAGTIRAKRWRHAMIHETVMAWEHAISYIPEFDVVGAGWQDSSTGFFFGNFWWARAGYLAGLPPVSDKTRYHAEHWLGLDIPRVKDLCPDFTTRYKLGWNYNYRMFDSGYDCDKC